MRDFVRMIAMLHRAVTSALDHDCLNVAQATAYSAIIALFPGLILAAALVGLLPDTLPLRFQLAMFFDRILPSNVSPLLETYFETTHRTPQSMHALIGSILVSITGGTGVMVTLMEGFRRAYDLPVEVGEFWRLRRRALTLMIFALVPFAVASALVVFGNLLTIWLGMHGAQGRRTPVYLFALAVRWGIALAGSIGIIAVIYHMGTPMEQRHPADPGTQPWQRVIPGASMATAMWFLSTLAFGWYVTRFANYSQVYGSLGAGIALLFWLYIIALSVLCGAEFNAQLFAKRAKDAAEWRGNGAQREHE